MTGGLEDREDPLQRLAEFAVPEFAHIRDVD